MQRTPESSILSLSVWSIDMKNTICGYFPLEQEEYVAHAIINVRTEVFDNWLSPPTFNLYVVDDVLEVYMVCQHECSHEAWDLFNAYFSGYIKGRLF